MSAGAVKASPHSIDSEANVGQEADTPHYAAASSDSLTRLVRDGPENVEGALGIIRALLVTTAMAEVG